MTKNDLGYKCNHFHSHSFEWIVQCIVRGGWMLERKWVDIPNLILFSYYEI